MRFKRMRWLVVAVPATLAFTGVAFAASNVYFEGNASGGPFLGPRHSLTETSVRVLDNSGACTTAYELNGQRAGTPSCVSGVNGLAAHPYNGTLRNPAFSESGGSVRARENY